MSHMHNARHKIDSNRHFQCLAMYYHKMLIVTKKLEGYNISIKFYPRFASPRAYKVKCS
jgi:hypothetical protein